MHPGWRISAVSLLAVGALGLVACGDDEPAPVSQEAYDSEAVRLCERHAQGVFDQADAIASTPTAAADKASFLVAEFVPRARAIVRSLDSYGYPPANAATYNAAAVDAMQALADIEADPLGLIDRENAGLLVDSENPFIALDTAMNALDIPCA